MPRPDGSPDHPIDVLCRIEAAVAPWAALGRSDELRCDELAERNVARGLYELERQIRERADEIRAWFADREGEVVR